MLTLGVRDRAAAQLSGGALRVGRIEGRVIDSVPARLGAVNPGTASTSLFRRRVGVDVTPSALAIRESTRRRRVNPVLVGALIGGAAAAVLLHDFGDYDSCVTDAGPGYCRAVQVVIVGVGVGVGAGLGALIGHLVSRDR